MAERLKKIPKQLLDIWNKYTSKQKTLIVSVACVVILAFVILIVLMNKVDYTQIKVCETTTEASKVVDILKKSNYKYKFDKDTLAVSVETKSSSDAILLLASNDITTDSIPFDKLLDNSLGTTNADRVLKLNLFMQSKLKNMIKKMDGIDDAEVYYIPKENSTNILTDKKEDTTASVHLTTNDDFKPETAETIATMVAATIGNENADKIKVSDQKGNLLYGGSDDLYSGKASSNEDYKERLRNNFINNLYMLLLKNGNYNDVVIAPDLRFNMDKVNQMYTEYSVPDGMDQGYYSYSKNTSSQNTGSSGGVPGTSSNDGTTYNTQNPSSSDSKSQSSEYKYIQNQRVTNTEYEVGAVIPDKSGVGIVLTRIHTIRQEDLEKSGALKGTNYAAYVADKNNSDAKPLTVDNNLKTLVSNATGVPEARITITAWEQPVFIPKANNTNWTDYIQIALVVLIVGLLIFVVLKGVKPVEVTELEPELSVEQLLATTKENQTIEDIEFNEVSEVRRMIEKFVDEKPEAVAQLLRNWLNEDWG
jgi:Flagellar biosynthesis/type III secretory pathway lipoprotein